MLKRIGLGFPTSWSHRRAYNLPCSTAGGAAPYYVEWEPHGGLFGEDWDTTPLDARGVLCDRIGYHPIRIAQYALHLHGRSCTGGDSSLRERFLAQARWLRDNQRRRGRIGGLYVFGFPWQKYGAGEGWHSAMAQGEAVSVLLRAEHVMPGGGFGDAASAAALPFKYRIEDGGVVWSHGEDAFFEEVANEYAAHILNGCIFAFWGLWELQRERPEPWHEEVLGRVSDTIVRWLPRYDTGWWSRYSLLRSAAGRPHVATLKYHAFHIAQLRVLAVMLGEPRVSEVAERWAGYVESADSRRRVLVDAAVSLYDRARSQDTVGGGARADVA